MEKTIKINFNNPGRVVLKRLDFVRLNHPNIIIEVNFVNVYQ